MFALHGRTLPHTKKRSYAKFSNCELSQTLRLGNGKNALYTLWTGAEVGELYIKRIVDKNGPIVKNEPVYLYVGLPL